MPRLTTVTLTLIVLLAAFGLSNAQVVYVLHKSVTATSDAINLPSATHPTGDDSFLDLIIDAYDGVASTSTAFLDGGHAIDQKTLTVFSSDGEFLQAEPMSHYSSAAAPPAVSLGGTLLGGGPVAGLAVDSDGGILYVTDGFTLGALSTTFPYPSVSPDVPLFFTGGEELSGLGFEPSTGTLWGVTPSGVVFNFDSTGGLIGFGPAGGAPLSGAPFAGLTVNTTNGTGAFAPPACSPQAPGYHILVSDGAAIYDALDPTAPPIPIPGSTGEVNGLAFSADAQYSFFGAGACSMLSPATISLSRPLYVGPPTTPATLDLAGATPLTSAVLLVDLCAATPDPRPLVRVPPHLSGHRDPRARHHHHPRHRLPAPSHRHRPGRHPALRPVGLLRTPQRPGPLLPHRHDDDDLLPPLIAVRCQTPNHRIRSMAQAPGAGLDASSVPVSFRLGCFIDGNGDFEQRRRIGSVREAMTTEAMSRDPESLLSHAGFLRALARELVGPVEAEDVVQDTWLAALNRPPRQRVRAWMSVVTRNLVRDRHRTSTARRRRETEVTRTGERAAVPGTDERIEIHRALVDAIASLDGPSREVVVLHYYDGLAPREIADRLGLPGSTVRARLRRALERLRGRLDQDAGGREVWALALAPLAAASSHKLTQLSIIGIIMNAKTVVGLICIVLLFASFSLFGGDDGSAELDSTPTLASGDAVEPRRAETANAVNEAVEVDQLDAHPGSAARDDDAAPASTGLEIVGRVLDDRRRAAPGIEVRFQCSGRTVSTRSSADGRFCLRVGMDVVAPGRSFCVHAFDRDGRTALRGRTFDDSAILEPIDCGAMVPACRFPGRGGRARGRPAGRGRPTGAAAGVHRARARSDVERGDQFDDRCSLREMDSPRAPRRPAWSRASVRLGNLDVGDARPDTRPYDPCPRDRRHQRRSRRGRGDSSAVPAAIDGPLRLRAHAATAGDGSSAHRG